MSVQVGSQAYLKNGSLHLQYDKLLEWLADVVVHMAAQKEWEVSQEMAYKFRGKKERLRDVWPLADEAIPVGSGALEGAFLQWMDRNMHRATDRESSNLKLAMC